MPLQAEIIPFEPEQVHTCGGTKMPLADISGKEYPLFYLRIEDLFILAYEKGFSIFDARVTAVYFRLFRKS